MRKGLDGAYIGSLVGFALDVCKNVGRVPLGYLGAELENPCWKGVFRRERGCVEVYDGLVLALVEGIVDVDEFCERGG